MPLPINSTWFQTVALQPPVGCGYTLHRTREIHETCNNVHCNDGIAANSYLLKGLDADLIIDTGIGVVDLFGHLKGAGLVGNDASRPLFVLATHEHFDHAGGLRHFQAATIIMGEADAGAVESGDPVLTYAGWVVTDYAAEPEYYWDAAPFPDFAASLANYTVQSRVDWKVRHGDVISLGGNASFQVLSLPGHTSGSIGLYNANGTREVYTGDAIYDEELYDFCPDSNKTAYIETMALLEALPTQLAYPGHFEPLQRARYDSIIACYVAGINPCPQDWVVPPSPATPPAMPLAPPPSFRSSDIHLLLLGAIGGGLFVAAVVGLICFTRRAASPPVPRFPAADLGTTTSTMTGGGEWELNDAAKAALETGEYRMGDGKIGRL